MHQLEVKRWLVHHCFPPHAGWRVCVHVDAMERAHGGAHPEGKAERVQLAEIELAALGVTIGLHPKFAPADIVAEHTEFGTVIAEVEGNTGKQKGQALYSALGQLVMQMRGDGQRFLLAFPDQPEWLKQANRVTEYARTKLDLSCVLVSANGVRDV